MGPKRASNATSGPSTPKKQRTQKTLASFFSPSSKSRALSNPNEIIEIIDSDSDSDGGNVQIESDEAMARRLAAEWAAEGSESVNGVKTEANVGGKGKGKAQEGDFALEIKVEVAVDEVVEVQDSPTPEPKPRPRSENNVAKPVHPMFQSRPPPDTKPLKAKEEPLEAGPSRPRKIFGEKGAPKESAPAIDFDSDSLLFRPQRVDTSLWPKGRLPYSVLVGVYVQVASTRSRLTIVRVLTK